MFENLLQKAMELNEMSGVDVYFCINGETQVVALSVMQNKTLVYQNRFFFPRLDNKVKEVTGVGSRCIPLEQKHHADTCVCCGKPAKHMVLWAKAY